MKKTRRQIDAALKAKIALEALREQSTVTRSGATLASACEPDLCVEEAASRSSGSGVRGGRWPGWLGGSRTGDREAPRQDRTIDRRARFLSQEVRKISAPDRRGLLGHEAKAGIARWIEFYNFQRPHQALKNRAPIAVWRAGAIGAFGEELWISRSRKREAWTTLRIPHIPTA